MPKGSAKAYDAFRQELRAAIEKAGKDLKSLSEGAGRNHAYLQQFITKGVPQELPERIRDYLAEEIGLDPIALKRLEVVWRPTTSGGLTRQPRSWSGGSSADDAHALSDRGRNFDPSPDQWSAPEGVSSSQLESVEQIVRTMTLVSTGGSVDGAEAAVENLTRLIFQAAAVARNRDRLEPLLHQACRSALEEHLIAIDAPTSRFNQLWTVLEPSVALLLHALRPEA